MNLFKRQPVIIPESSGRIPVKKESNDCEIKVKRDSEGRVIGIKRKGNCKKEDVMAFISQNGLDIKEFE